MIIKCIAVDDEPLALRQIEDYIKKTPFLECVAVFRSALDALSFISDNDIELMFVDIQMPDLNGMDFVKSLANRPQVIFTTAFAEYAAEGFKVNALDYILKPVAYSDFLRSANKAREWFELHNLKFHEEGKKNDEIFVKSSGKLVKIVLNEIVFVESANEYIVINTVNGEKITSLIRLKDFEKTLPENDFMRIHRSFIVNLNLIKAIERNILTMSSGKKIPVGEMYREDFKIFSDKRFK